MTRHVFFSLMFST